MSYKVSKISGEANYESLPVAKVVSYPMEEREYRPFAQNILCVSDTYLHLRMWAFEVNPPAASRLESVLYIFESAPDTALTVVAAPVSDTNTDMLGCCLLKNGHELPMTEHVGRMLQDISLRPHNGEDLQGVYWGYTIDIPLELLEDWSGKLRLTPGSHFPGNFYKICVEEPYVHLGSYASADFSGNPYLPESMGDFEVVTY